MGKKNGNKKNGNKKNGSKTERNYAGVTPKTFIEIWQSAGTVAEIAEETGMTARALGSRASAYRKKGIELKKFHGTGGGRRLDVDALKKLADKHAPSA